MKSMLIFQNPDFEFTTLAPLEEPTTPGYGNNGDGGADGKDGASSEESGERGTDGGYGIKQSVKNMIDNPLYF